MYKLACYELPMIASEQGYGSMDYYVAQVSTGAELKIRKLIELHNPEVHSLIYIPQKRISIRKMGKTRDKKQIIFPGYLFFAENTEERSIIDIMRRHPQIIRILPDNFHPKALEGKDLELIKHLLSFGDVLEKSLVSFSEKDRITILEGPLKGLEGNIIKVDKRKQRARVKLDIYSESFLVDFGFDHMANN